MPRISQDALTEWRRIVNDPDAGQRIPSSAEVFCKGAEWADARAAVRIAELETQVAQLRAGGSIAPPITHTAEQRPRVLGDLKMTDPVSSLIPWAEVAAKLREQTPAPEMWDEPSLFTTRYAVHALADAIEALA